MRAVQEGAQLSTGTIERTHPTDQLSDRDADDLWHYVCECDTDTAMCGYDVTYAKWISEDNDEDLCLACVEMAQLACFRCDW